MTKKSPSRLARDVQREKLKDNTCWDDVNEIHSKCLLLLLKHQNVLDLSRNKELVNAVDDRKTMLHLIMSLGNDINTLTKELQEIQNQHAGKVGGSQNPDEVMFSITIYEQYGLFMDRHEAVCIPTAMQIGEIFDKAFNKLEIIRLGQAIEKANNMSDEERAELARQQQNVQELNAAAVAVAAEQQVIVETKVSEATEPTVAAEPSVEETASIEQTIQG